MNGRRRVALAVVVAGAATIASAQPPATAEALAGIWHACAEVGAGYCERWVLAPDGRFEARAAQTGCSRLARRTGRWTLEGTTLVVTETSRTTRVGGRCVRDETGEELRGARDVTRSRERIERIPLRACSSAERDQSPAACVRFGRTTRWRLATEESMEPGAR